MKTTIKKEKLRSFSNKTSEELHEASKTWLSEIDFITYEIQFLKHLLGAKYIDCLDVGLYERIKEVTKEIFDKKNDCINLKKLVKNHETKLSDLIDQHSGWELDNKLERAMDALRCPPEEAIIKNLKMSNTELKQFLGENGDSVVVAGSENTRRIHVHTNQPADLFFKLKNKGTITFQKVDDMQRQQEVSNNRKWKIALITDSINDPVVVPKGISLKSSSSIA